MATAEKDMLSARQLLVLGLLENLTIYLGGPPTLHRFYHYFPLDFPMADTLMALNDAGLIEDEGGRLIRRYSWEPVGRLPQPRAPKPKIVLIPCRSCGRKRGHHPACSRKNSFAYARDGGTFA